MVNEGAGEVFEYDGRRLYGVCVAEKGVFRFTLTTQGTAGHASIPRIGDNALTKLAPAARGARAAAASRRSTQPEPDALPRRRSASTPSDLPRALAEVEAEPIPRIAVLLEPMLGVTLAPTMASASEKINVIPSRAQPEGGLPGAARPRARTTRSSGSARPWANGFEVEFDETVVGNRSPIDTPLMDVDPRRSSSARTRAPASRRVVLPGFSDSRWWREAFPDCVAYGFFPQKAMNLFEAAPLIHGANERVPVEDLGLAARFYSGSDRGDAVSE